MRGGRVQGEGSGRSPAARGGESRLRLLCSGFAGTGCAPARPLAGAFRGPPAPAANTEGKRNSCEKGKKGV
mgnify:CR=1 FL=1